MTGASAVLVSLRVRAAPARAFACFTDEIALWWRPLGLLAITPQGDGRLRFEGGSAGRLVTDLPDGTTFEIGRVTEWRPPEKLAFTWRPASFGPEQETRVEVAFEPVGDETRVSVTHFGWAEIPRGHAARHGFPDQPFLKHVAEWWRVHLARLGTRASTSEM